MVLTAGVNTSNIAETRTTHMVGPFWKPHDNAALHMKGTPEGPMI